MYFLRFLKRKIEKFYTYYIFIFIFYNSVWGQPVHYFKPLTITASRLYTSLATETREIFVLDRKEIVEIPAGSVSGLLQYMGCVDMRRRGAGGVQADFSIRGSSFEQVLVMLDGIRLNDPQTGHHNSDIPISVAEIERIEVLSGHGSSLYGSEAFGGVINILTKSPLKNQTIIEVKGGNFGTISGQFSKSFGLGSLRNRISVEKQKSDGYRWDTDYDITTASYYSDLRFGNKEIDLSIGYTTKDFGANGFYAPYPSREKTSTTFGRANLVFQPSSFFILQSRVFGKRHNDTFVLDFQRPSWYKNSHCTDVWGGEVQANFRFSNNREMALGVEVLSENLRSDRLGNRKRFSIGLFSEVAYLIVNRFILDSGVRVDYQKGWGVEVNPSVGFSISINKNFRWRNSIGRVFRAPTFTELYYDSPSNIGNPELKPEHGLCSETGFVWMRKNYHAEITLFSRNERNRIDWITQDKKSPWQVYNIDKGNVIGISVSTRWTLNNRIRIRLNYNWINWQNDRKGNYLYKYGFNTLRHHFLSTCFIMWPCRIGQSLLFNIKQRDQAPAYWILDIKFTRHFKKATVFLELTNLLGAKYEEIPGCPMPMQGIRAGVLFDI